MVRKKVNNEDFRQFFKCCVRVHLCKYYSDALVETYIWVFEIRNY